jgi:NAD(P)H dehydrogenase (quinone)
MTRILIVYASDYGNTRKMAQTIADGARSVADTEVVVKTAEEATAEDLQGADALMLGSPVHMGSVDWRVKKFIDTVCSQLWMQDGAIGKVGAVFATGSGYGNVGGGAELTLLAMLNNIAELGMIIVPLPKRTPGYAKSGLQWGAYARSAGENLEQNGVSEESLVAARHHGVHVARVAAAIQAKTIFG